MFEHLLNRVSVLPSDAQIAIYCTAIGCLTLLVLMLTRIVCRHVAILARGWPPRRFEYDDTPEISEIPDEITVQAHFYVHLVPFASGEDLDDDEYEDDPEAESDK